MELNYCSFNLIGEVLVGLDQVDENWWYGRSADGREGIFPTSLTWKANLLSSFIKVHKVIFTEI